MVSRPVPNEVRWNVRSGQTVIDLIVATGCCVFLLTLVVLATGCATSRQNTNNCGNNIKRMVRALQNYHDSFNYLPYGTRTRSTKPYYTSASWGPSWFLAVLPYCDQGKLVNQLTKADHAAEENDYQSPAIFKVADNKEITCLRCPASPLPVMQTVSGTKIAVPTYAGIMGSKIDVIKRAVEGPYGGLATSNGMLLINESVSYAACTDGKANVIIVGEISNWYYDDKGAKRNPAPSITRTGGNEKPVGGWFAGNNLYLKGLHGQLQTVRDGEAIFADTSFNLLAITLPVNSNNKGGPKDGAPNWGTQGVGRCGFNNPLSSAHGDGAMAGFLDGHVKLVPSATDTEVLFRLACRDDGGKLPNDF